MSTTWSRGTVMQELMQPLHPSHRYTQTWQTISVTSLYGNNIKCHLILFLNEASKHTDPCNSHIIFLIPIFKFYDSQQLWFISLHMLYYYCLFSYYIHVFIFLIFVNTISTNIIHRTRGYLVTSLKIYIHIQHINLQPMIHKQKTW